MSADQHGESPTKAERTRQRILVATTHQLAQNGYGGTSLRKVAAAAGLHPGSLAFHFATKDELIAAAMREGIEFAHDVVVGALAAIPSDAGPEQRLAVAIDAHLEALHSSQDRSAAVVRMVATLPLDLRRGQAVHARRYGSVWLHLLGDFQRAGGLGGEVDLRTLRDVVLGALNATATQESITPDRIAQVADMVLQLVLGTLPRET